jgi:peroxiredoxin
MFSFSTKSRYRLNFHRMKRQWTLSLTIVCAGTLSLAAVVNDAQAQRASRRPPSQRNIERNTQLNDPLMQETPSALLLGSYYEHDRKPLSVGTVAPVFTLPYAEGSLKPSAGDVRKAGLTSASLEFDQFRQKPGGATVLIFWAFWCDTWKDVTRHMKTLRKPLTDARVKVACVAVDASQQPVARQAFSSGDIWFPVAIDRESKVSSNWGVRRVPTVFVIDSKGKISHYFEGFPRDRDLLAALKQPK